jgi:hypothetical protein
MKNKIKLMCMLLTGILLVSCGPSKQDAIKYNDSITIEQKKVVHVETKLTDANKSGNTGALEGILKELSLQIDKSTAKVKDIKSFDGKTDLKDAALAFLTTYRDVVDKEYPAWLENVQTPPDKVTGKLLDEEKALISSINGKLDKAASDFKRAQEAFADKYKFIFGRD